MNSSSPRHETFSFDLIEKIGEGSFGEVWLAEDRELRKKTAVKFLKLDLKASQEPHALALFKREFEILSELKHAHLARVLHFGFDDGQGRYFLSEEYSPGRPLREALQGKGVEYFEEILVQILSALDYIHSQGVIHFDLKPENILIETEGDRPSVKLMDFGVAARLAALPQGVGGSPAYMAPERIRPEVRPDHRVDLYSLGAISLEALMENLPFDVENPKAALEWHLKGSIPEEFLRRREIPSYLKELVKKLLAKNPSDRFSNARVALNFLNLATGGKYRQVEEDLQAEIPLEGPLVERREVLEGLKKRIEGLSPSNRSISPVCFISGERGIGKSRILEECLHLLELQEIRHRKITCDWEVPAWPKLAEALGLPSLSHDEMNEEWQARRRMYALVEAAGEKPLCLLIDDFHKADPALKKTVLGLQEKTSPLPFGCRGHRRGGLGGHPTQTS